MGKLGLIQSLNAVRQNSSENYQRNIAELNEDSSIEAFSAPLIHMPELYNEFCNNLIQRIVYTQVEAKIFRNPLKVLEGDTIPLGYAGQEIYINPALGRDYNQDDFAGLLKKYESDVKVQYQGINFDKQYPVTIIRQKLKQAFVSWVALEEFITSMTNSLYNGYYIDEYNNTKGLVTRAYLSNAVQIETIQAPNTTDLATKFVERARTLFLNFQTPSTQYNAWNKVGGYGRAINTFTNAEDIVMLIKNDLRAKLDVSLLANAFNIDKTTLLGNILPVDDFTIRDGLGNVLFDGSKIQAIICDKSWFRIKTQDEFMDSQANANNRSMNYYLNVIKMFNYSFFANAVVFATEIPSIPITKLDFNPGEISMEKVGDKEGLDIIVSPANANNPNIVYTSSDEYIFIVEADTNNNKHCKITATGIGTATLTAKAGNVTTSLSVKVLAAAE